MNNLYIIIHTSTKTENIVSAVSYNSYQELRLHRQYSKEH